MDEKEADCDAHGSAGRSADAAICALMSVGDGWYCVFVDCCSNLARERGMGSAGEITRAHTFTSQVREERGRQVCERPSAHASAGEREGIATALPVPEAQCFVDCVELQRLDLVVLVRQLRLERCPQRHSQSYGCMRTLWRPGLAAHRH